MMMMLLVMMMLVMSLVVVVVDDVVDQYGVVLLLGLVLAANAIAIQIVAMRFPGGYKQLLANIRMRFQLLHCKAKGLNNVFSCDLITIYNLHTKSAGL